MPRSLNVHFLPALTAPEELSGGIVVVIDILRASTTIASALAAGASCVIPCLEVDEARSLAAGFPPDEVRLGGERACVKIDGFDLGNSPAEFTPATVGGRKVIFTTTNGTRALLQCRFAATVFMAGFVNTAATVKALNGEQSADIHLMCAGTAGHVSREDVLFAGCLLERLSVEPFDWDDASELAFAAWQECDQSNLAGELRLSRGGRNLIRNGLEADIALAAAVDSLDFAVRFDAASGRIQRL